MSMIDPQDTPEHRAAMNIRAMHAALDDLLAMAGDKYGLPVVMRDSRDLESLQDDLARLLMLLQRGNLRAVS